jgi:hypothetical protein
MVGSGGARGVFVLSLRRRWPSVAACVCALAFTACVKFSPEVKQTFEPQSAKEHSNFEPRSPPYGPIYVGPMPSDAGADVVDAMSPPIDLDAAPPFPAPAPIPAAPAEGGVL